MADAPYRGGQSGVATLAPSPESDGRTMIINMGP